MFSDGQPGDFLYKAAVLVGTGEEIKGVLHGPDVFLFENFGKTGPDPLEILNGSLQFLTHFLKFGIGGRWRGFFARGLSGPHFFQKTLGLLDPASLRFQIQGIESVESRPKVFQKTVGKRRVGEKTGLIQPGMDIWLQAFQLPQICIVVVRSVEEGLFQGFEDLPPFRRWIEGAVFHIVSVYIFLVAEKPKGIKKNLFLNRPEETQRLPLGQAFASLDKGASGSPKRQNSSQGRMRASAVVAKHPFSPRVSLRKSF